jgi:AraC-like DNA-binding protein
MTIWNGLCRKVRYLFAIVHSLMDPLSDVLSLLRLRSYMSASFDAGGDWSLRFGPHEGIKFQAVVSGGCWICVEGVAEPVWAVAGDCLFLPRGRPFRVASDPALTPVDGATLQAGREGGVNTMNGGGDFFSLGGYFTFANDHASLLLALLPPIVHIRTESDKAELRWCLERLRRELQAPQPGGFLVAQQLASLMLVQALRLHLAAGSIGGVGWLSALADKQMSAAIQAMHAEPARRWSLQSLATCVGMSRTSFALKFRDMVGVSAMTYLGRWRMLLAADRLIKSGESLAAIAQSLGYESESAFSTAFKRVMGVSPRLYGRTARLQSAAEADDEALRTKGVDREMQRR